MAGSLAHSDGQAPVRRFLDALAATIRAAAGVAHASASAALHDFASAVAAIDATGANARPPVRVAVCRFWEDALHRAHGDLVEPLAAFGARLSWTQNPNYVRQPPDAGFLDSYGYAVIAGPADGPPALAHASDLAVGVLLLGPGTHYPVHAHPAVELYVTLTPDGEWWRAGGPWRRESAGSVIYHASGVPHATRAGRAPVLAVYLWRGELATHARLRPARSSR